MLIYVTMFVFNHRLSHFCESQKTNVHVLKSYAEQKFTEHINYHKTTLNLQTKNT